MHIWFAYVQYVGFIFCFWFSNNLLIAEPETKNEPDVLDVSEKSLGELLTKYLFLQFKHHLRFLTSKWLISNKFECLFSFFVFHYLLLTVIFGSI